MANKKQNKRSQELINKRKKLIVEADYQDFINKFVLINMSTNVDVWESQCAGIVVDAGDYGITIEGSITEVTYKEVENISTDLNRTEELSRLLNQNQKTGKWSISWSQIQDFVFLK